MDGEIERLKTLQKTLKNKIKVVSDFDEKEMLHDQVNKLEEQIQTLQRFRTT